MPTYTTSWSGASDPTDDTEVTTSGPSMVVSTSEGTMFCLSDYRSFDDDGFLYVFDSRFTLMWNDAHLANTIDGMAAGQVTILREIFPYDYEDFDEANTHIEMTYTACNVETSDPELTITDYFVAVTQSAAQLEASGDEEGAYVETTSTGKGAYSIMGSWTGPIEEYTHYAISYASTEEGYIADLFSFDNGNTVEQVLSASWTTLAKEIYDQLINTTKKVFNRTAAQPLVPNYFSTLSQITPISGSAPASQTAAPFTLTTSTY